MALVVTWAEKQSPLQSAHVRFDLIPADHCPRWVVTCAITPQPTTKVSLTGHDTGGSSGGKLRRKSGITAQAQSLQSRWTSEEAATSLASLAAD